MRRHPKCYAAELGACSDDISAEHFFSKGILTLLNDGPNFGVSGFPWQEPEQAAQLSPATLAAKILCTRHNSELSLLDDECLTVFQFVEQAHKTLSDTQCEGDRSYEVSGDLVERWVLKALIGLVASGNAAKGDKRISKDKPPLAWLQLLYGLEAMPEEWGLYLTSQVGDRVMSTRGLAFAPLIHDMKVIGCLLTIHDCRFLLAMSTPGADRHGSLLENAIYRPAHLRFVHTDRRCSVQLLLKWREQRAGRGIEIRYSGAAA